MLIDSHCHLQSCFTPQEIPAYLNEIHSSIEYLVDLSTNFEEILKKKHISLPEWVFSSFGLLPEYSTKDIKKLVPKINNVFKHDTFHAVGEIGMDYHWNEGTPIEQERLFRAQLEIAIEAHLPIIIHSREAFEDTYRILKSYSFQYPVILHCFGYGPKESEAFLSLGFYISFAGNLTFKKAINLQEAIKTVPQERLLLETDSPYLTPVPHRGEPNRPHLVQHTYEFAAKLRNVSLFDLQIQIKKNFKKIFYLS